MDLKTMLDDKAEEMRLDPRIPRGVLRRARRRRAVNAALASAVTVGLALGAFVGARELLEAYASHEDGLDLLRYAASEDLRFSRIVQYDKLSPDRHRVVVLFVLSRPAAGEFEPERIHEVLTIEPLDEGFVVADAERRFSG